MKQVSLPVRITEGVRTAPFLPSKALSSPFTRNSCQLLYYSVPQVPQRACGVAPGSSGIAVLLTPQRVFVLAATLDQILCGITLREALLPFQLLAGVAEQIHTLWGDGKHIGVRGRDLLWVNCEDATPTHASHSSQDFIQSSKTAEAKLLKSVFLLGPKEQKPPNYYRKRKKLCQLFFQEDGKLEGTPQS